MAIQKQERETPMNKFVRLETHGFQAVAIYKYIPKPSLPGEPKLTFPTSTEGEWICHENTLRARIENSKKWGIDCSEDSKVLASLLRLKSQIRVKQKTGSTCSSLVGFGISLGNEESQIDLEKIELKIILQGFSDILEIETAGDFSRDNVSYTNMLIIKDSIIKTSGNNVVEYSYATMTLKVGKWIEILKIFCRDSGIPFDPNNAKFYLFGNYN